MRVIDGLCIEDGRFSIRDMGKEDHNLQESKVIIGRKVKYPSSAMLGK